MKQLRQWLEKFMVGRYGIDLLNTHLLWLFLGIGFIGIVFRSELFRLVSVGVLAYLYFRIFSRNLLRRNQEMVRYQKWLTALKYFRKKIFGFFKYRYVTCPACQKKVRVLKQKGEQKVTCPFCDHQFTTASTKRQTLK